MSSNTTTPDSCVTDDAAGDGQYTVFCMTRAQTIGLAFTVESGMISLVAVVILFALVIRNVQRHKRMYPTRKWRLIQRPMDAYMLSLFSLDFFQALGAVFDIKWVNQGKAYVGGYCTAQGAIQQFGEAGSAIMTMIITIHTFLMICRIAPTINHSVIVAYGVVIFVYLFLVLWVSLGVGLNRDPSKLYITPTPYWCWLGSKYLGERIAGEYLWLWLTLVTSFLVYIPIFLWSRGNLQMGDRWWKARLHWTPHTVIALDRQRQTSFSILAYPVAYTFLVLPLSIIRWITFADTTLTVPSGWSFFAVIIFGFSGTVNVLLLRFTRPGLLLFSQPAVSSRDVGSATQGSRVQYSRADGESAYGTTEIHVGRAPSLPTQSHSSMTFEDVGGVEPVGGVPTPPEPTYEPYDVHQLHTIASASGSGSAGGSMAHSRARISNARRANDRTSGDSAYELVTVEDEEHGALPEGVH